MHELEWFKEFRRWIESDKAEKSAKNLSEAFRNLRQNIEPLNKELKELNSSAKKSKELLAKLANLQKGVEKQTKWLIILTVVMILFAALQLYLTWKNGLP